MTTPEPLSEAEIAAWRADPDRDSHHAPGRCWVTIDALTARAEAAEQQAVANDIERAGWQATAEAAETTLAEAVELLRRVRDTHHVVRPCHCEVCAFLAARDAPEDQS